MADSIYTKLRKERVEQQEKGLLPDWYITGGWQMFKEKYLYQADSFKEQVERIAKTAAQYLPNSEEWEKKFFDLIWYGKLSCSTPVLANMGTDRGLPVSCSGNYVEDSIDGFYSARREVALLTKYGFGTSSYLGDIRPRGSSISVGGKASGVVPVLKGFVQDMRDVSQGTARRGAWAGYLPLNHPDFYEVARLLEAEPDDLNIGWNIYDKDVEALNNGDKELQKRFKHALKVKAVTGKGYFFFPDKANRKRPESYVKNGLEVKASQLCSEIILFSDKDHTYTCVLSSLNLARWDEMTDEDIFNAVVFLDCVAEDFIQKAKNIKGLEKAVLFTEKGRALGLGVCGFHTLLQQRELSFGCLETHILNNQIFKRIRKVADEATAYLAKELGEPEWCKGLGRRNTHTLAVAPTMSTALLMGGVSQGIEPIVANVYTQTTSAGEVERINPVLLDLMKERGVFNKKTLNSIIDAQGSVQHVDWLDEEEKKWFRTAFEIDQRDIIRLAEARQNYLDQGQSLNLFFSADEDEQYIAQVHKEAFENENILALYYMRTQAGVQASKDSCEACQ